MDEKKEERAGYSVQGTTSSSGTASIRTYIHDKVESDQELSYLADSIARVASHMLNNGSIRLLSPTDISERYGKTRQYWEKLIRNGKIPYVQTGAGKITTNIWVEGYINDPEYGNWVIEMRSRIIRNQKDNNKSSGTVECSNCGNKFDYYWNDGNHINGICSCGRHLHTQV